MAVDYSANPEKKSGIGLLLFFLISLAVVCAAILVIKSRFTITSVEITGNEHYTADQIEEQVLRGKYGHNSIYLYLKGVLGKTDDIPFVEKMDVELVSPTSVKIRVYEKAVAGYVEYLGHYLYFDKDGIVVESSTEQIEGIPFVTGLDFNYVTLHDKLPVEKEDVFRLILSITQLVTKYRIGVDKIYFDKNYNITLYYGDVRVYLGSSDFIDEKINRLRFVLPQLKGYSGVLHMENYEGEGDKFTFTKD
ncbi:MAG: FtsQ-type POTRA domain-containing protein [Lachnospiraceae bacterium]|nr:FtsQ-type POTRA domain-containing protein [Lachnospiraceae bacterium]